MRDETEPADIDAIADALGRLRGRRRPPGIFAGRAGAFDGPGGSHRPSDDADSPWRHLPHGHARHTPDDGPDGGAVHRGRGWGGPGRMGGLARLRLLEALAAASRPLSVGEIGEAIGVDQPRASRVIQQAADLGWVRREADPDDARRTRVALTDAGAATARGVHAERRAQIGVALVGFDADERSELARLLTKLADAWPRDAAGGDAAPSGGARGAR